LELERVVSSGWRSEKGKTAGSGPFGRRAGGGGRGGLEDQNSFGEGSRKGGEKMLYEVREKVEF